MAADPAGLLHPHVTARFSARRNFACIRKLMM